MPTHFCNGMPCTICFPGTYTATTYGAPIIRLEYDLEDPIEKIARIFIEAEKKLTPSKRKKARARLRELAETGR